MSATLPGEAARTAVACITCRERKIKCSGEQPCRFCMKRGLRCVVRETSKRKLYPVAYVEELERRAARGGQSPNQVQETVDSSRLPCQSNSSAPPSLAQAGLPIEVDSTMSSSLNFGSHIKAMSAASVPRCSEHTVAGSRPDSTYALNIPQPQRSRDPSQTPPIPSESEAQELLDTVVGSLGRLQHLFDPRALADCLATVDDPGADSAQASVLWRIEMLMVFAIGRLLAGTLKEDEAFPGERFFLEAMAQLPNVCEITAAGTLGIEIMGLIAFYLQCADRKEDAYIYAGIGLRIALLMGLHWEFGSSAGLIRSQRTHRNRNPLSVHDEAIRVSYPTDTPGFYSADALTTNIKVARTTGHILQKQAIYGSKEQTKDEFIMEVHKILSSLQEISVSMPKDLTLDFCTRLQISRHSATLHLMLYQAIILATRPVLLHLAREKIRSNHGDSFTSQHLHQLAKPCTDASRRSLAILQALRQDNILATFGFFDLDAIFSVAFVFVLCESIYPHPHGDSCLQSIEETLGLLQYLVSRGNRAASNRKLDIIQMCEHLGITIDQGPLSQHGEMRDPCDVHPDVPSNFDQVPERHDPASTRDPSEPDGTMADGIALAASLPADPLPWDRDTSLSEIFTGYDNSELYSLYCDGNLPLTGTVETDWDIFERQTLRPD
ncbi:hypothetical protein FE257_004993 [Aspergillus nanangensis]|uniref:Zn(2)-C6 fungal-type domain-containing protein n=1 Tax=Aspergillus nanangensis TaxID=2582783 RepID=A0AAD4GX05_ASPNN|nr:hypothetical protein FE257_004993 [Aspergillus nanangensis]